MMYTSIKDNLLFESISEELSEGTTALDGFSVR